MFSNEFIRIWQQENSKILDIRRNKIIDSSFTYQLPANAFLFATKGASKLCLDGDLYTFDSFTLQHAPKGSYLDIYTHKNIEFYIILYKLQHLLPLKKQPYFDAQHYSFMPLQPLPILELIQQMHSAWLQQLPLERLHAKGLFLQFIYEVISQIQTQNITLQSPNSMAQAIRYINEHYKENITLQSIATVLGCSAGYLSKNFKAQLATSPIQYVNTVRIHHAIKLLLHSDATLQQIAENTGYLDGYSLSRSFKKKMGMSPIKFKNTWQHRKQDLPSYNKETAILSPNSLKYNVIEIENNYQLEKGEYFMYKNLKATTMSLVLCLTLLLGACSSATPTQPTSDTETTTSEQATAVETRTVSTPRGDVEVPAEPKRVASDQYMGQLLKLGIIPVGVREGMLTEAWIEKADIPKETIDKIESLGNFPMDAEKLIALEPDLIIGSIEDNIDQYEKIGTTVFIPYWEKESTAGPLEKFKKISTVFGKEKEADAWIADYKQQVADAKEKIKGIIKEGETVSVVQLSSTGLFVLAAEGGNYGSSTIYQMLELPPTDKAQNMTEGFENISLEVLNDYLGDHVFVYINSEDDAKPILDSMIWKNSKPVQNGNVYMYGQFDDEFVMEDPYSLELQLKKIVKVLTEKQ